MKTKTHTDLEKQLHYILFYNPEHNRAGVHLTGHKLRTLRVNTILKTITFKKLTKHACEKLQQKTKAAIHERTLPKLRQAIKRFCLSPWEREL